MWSQLSELQLLVLADLFVAIILCTFYPPEIAFE